MTQGSQHAVSRSPALRSDLRPVFRSERSRVSASEATDVTVEMRLDLTPLDVEPALQRLEGLLARQAGSQIGAGALLSMTREVMTEVIGARLERELGGEFDDIVAAYRDMLELRVAAGHDEQISRALTRAKLQSDTLASVPMVGQAEACALLGLSGTNPSATLRRYEARDRILRFDWRGGAAYPLFQFDVEERRVHPTLLRLLEMRTDAWGGRMALLHWLTRPNRSLQGARPCDRLGDGGGEVVQSFAAELAEALNG